MTLGARRSRVLGAIWILAGLGLTAAAVLLWLDRQTVSVWELPLAIVAFGVGAWLWSQRVTIDRYGVTLSSLTGTERTLWAGIESVEVQATWWRPALTINRKGDGSVTSVRTTSGLTSSQRSELFDVLHELSREHGFAIRRKGFGRLASASDHLDGDGGGAAGIGLLAAPGDEAGTADEAGDVLADEPAGDDAILATASDEATAVDPVGDDATLATKPDDDAGVDADDTMAIDPVILDAMDGHDGDGTDVAASDAPVDGDEAPADPDDTDKVEVVIERPLDDGKGSPEAAPRP